MAEALESELLAVPGIAGAEVESDSGVAGVRVQLATGADAELVGAEVRRILAEHGMRSAAVEGDEQGYGPPPPPGAPGSVVSFPLIGAHALPQPTGDNAGLAAPRLESVAVEETLQGITVSVRSSDGRRAQRIPEQGMSGMDEAVVAAVAELADADDVSLVGINEAELGGHVVATVLISVGTSRHASGAAVQQGGRAYAVARATWVALSSQVPSRSSR